MVLRTRLTEGLGITYPIISAPMAFASGGQLAAAVSAAGGLGLIGGHLHLELGWGALVHDFVNIDGGKGEHAHQQEIANDDEDAAIHGVVAKARAAAGATGSGEMASASSSSLRRNGRKWQKNWRALVCIPPPACR